MRPTLALAICGVAWIGAAPIAAPQHPPSAAAPTAAEIATAIQEGTAGKVIEASCLASGFNGTQDRSYYGVVVAGPIGRIMAAAKAAADQHVSFQTADVTGKLRAPVLTVSTEAVTPLSVRWRLPLGDGVPDPYSRIVLRSSASKDQHQVSLEPLKPIEAQIAGMSTFSLKAFRALPDAAIEVVLSTSAHPEGGYTCKIGSENRTNLR